MDIKVICEVGNGRTTLSAFDHALKDAGVYNYNLITKGFMQIQAY